MIISKSHRKLAYERYINNHLIISKSYHDYIKISKYHDNIKISPWLAYEKYINNHLIILKQYQNNVMIISNHIMIISKPQNLRISQQI